MVAVARDEFLAGRRDPPVQCLAVLGKVALGAFEVGLELLLLLGAGRVVHRFPQPFQIGQRRDVVDGTTRTRAERPRPTRAEDSTGFSAVASTVRTPSTIRTVSSRAWMIRRQ